MLWYPVGKIFKTFFKDDLSYKKPSTQLHTSQYNASLAVDGSIETCMRTEPIGIGPTSSVHTVWWKVDLGRIYSIYSIAILFRNYVKYGKQFKHRFLSGLLYGFKIHFRDLKNHKLTGPLKES